MEKSWFESELGKRIEESIFYNPAEKFPKKLKKEKEEKNAIGTCSEDQIIR